MLAGRTAGVTLSVCGGVHTRATTAESRSASQRSGCYYFWLSWRVWMHAWSQTETEKVVDKHKTSTFSHIACGIFSCIFWLHTVFQHDLQRTGGLMEVTRLGSSVENKIYWENGYGQCQIGSFQHYTFIFTFFYKDVIMSDRAYRVRLEILYIYAIHMSFHIC